MALSDSTGFVVNRITYGTYGEIVAATTSPTTPFLYNGAYGVQTDFNGLLHMRARYYSTELRRFINADPIGFSGGMNWFAYASGDSINFADPFGTFRVRQFIRGVALVATGTIGAIASSAIATTGVGTAFGVVGALSSATAITVGIGNIVESFTGDSSTEGQMEGYPTNVGGLTGRAIGGEEGQKIGNVVESAVNVTSSLA